MKSKAKLFVNHLYFKKSDFSKFKKLFSFADSITIDPVRKMSKTDKLPRFKLFGGGARKNTLVQDYGMLLL